LWREGRSGSRGGFDEGDGNRTTEETATGAVVISVLLAPLQSISESLDSQEDSRIPVCTFPHLFFLSTRCGTRRGCFGALLWEGRAGILVFTGRQCVRAYRLRVAVSLQVFRCDVARVGSEPTLAFPMASEEKQFGQEMDTRFGKKIAHCCTVKRQLAGFRGSFCTKQCRFGPVRTGDGYTDFRIRYGDFGGL